MVGGELILLFVTVDLTGFVDDLTGSVSEDLTGVMSNDLTGVMSNDLTGIMSNDLTGRLTQDLTGSYRCMGVTPSGMTYRHVVLVRLRGVNQDTPQDVYK